MAIQKWLIDPKHTSVKFKVRHLGIGSVSGKFKNFSGFANSSYDDFNNAEIIFELSTDSIDTDNAERDNHLKSDLFLNVQEFPKISFAGTITKKEKEYRLEGNLTILNTTKPVSLSVDHTGTGVGIFNDTRAGFEITGTINRKDFGLTFNSLTGAGNLIVGEEIKLDMDVELIAEKTT